MPLGKIVQVLEKHYVDEAPVIGSLTTLYNGVAKLDSDLFWTEGGKQMLLDPRSSFGDECRKLKLNVCDNQPTKYFTCENVEYAYDRESNIGMYYGTARCYCGKTLKKEIPVWSSFFNAVDGMGGVFTASGATFIISDDLQISPNVTNVTSSIRQTLSNLGITDIDEAETRNVSFGFNEIMDLLKGSLLSRAPLTDLILKKQTGYEPGISFTQIVKRFTSYGLSAPLIVTLQKSTNKLLFAEANEEVVDFLFSLLTIPLGLVEYLLGNSTPFTNIDNLYRSIACHIDNKYLRTEAKTKLIKPTIPHCFLSENTIFPLIEEKAPELYYANDNSPRDEWLYTYATRKKTCDLASPKGGDSYVMGLRTYMVKDDLTVTPLSMTLYLSALKEQKIPLSDVEEMVLPIALEEALNILNASLTSSCALSNGLKNLMKKQPRQEY